MSSRLLTVSLMAGVGLGCLLVLTADEIAARSMSPGSGGNSSATSSLGPMGDTERNVTYTIRGSNPRRNREVTGDVTDEVDGVPASPVDSFCYDGIGSEPIKGSIKMEVDPIDNVGFVKARWHDEHGRWTLSMDFFVHPHHPSGLRVAPDAFDEELVILDPMVTNVYLHGNSTAGQPVAPTVFTYLATWGPATVTLNGQPFENDYDGAFMPQWNAHLMLTAGIRDDDGTIRADNGDIYNPMEHAAAGYSEHEDLELHLTWHDERFPEDFTNFPPLFDFFYHVLFEDVSIRIKHFHSEGEK